MFLREQSGDSHLGGRQWPQNTHIPRRLAWRAEHRGKPAKAAECALCCCRRGERSRPRRIRGRRARLRPAAWLPQCAEGTDARQNAYRHTHAKYRLTESRFSSNYLNIVAIITAKARWRWLEGCAGSKVRCAPTDEPVTVLYAPRATHFATRIIRAVVGTHASSNPRPVVSWFARP